MHLCTARAETRFSGFLPAEYLNGEKIVFRTVLFTRFLYRPCHRAAGKRLHFEWVDSASSILSCVMFRPQKHNRVTTKKGTVRVRESEHVRCKLACVYASMLPFCVVRSHIVNVIMRWLMDERFLASPSTPLSLCSLPDARVCVIRLAAPNRRQSR